MEKLMFRPQFFPEKTGGICITRHELPGANQVTNFSRSARTELHGPYTQTKHPPVQRPVSRYPSEKSISKGTSGKYETYTPCAPEYAPDFEGPATDYLRFRGDPLKSAPTVPNPNFPGRQASRIDDERSRAFFQT
mmetsp:Transcript_22694/g.44927  ORF Transcript_22694/g.44927 Transcript_22694/m.44927 type:complete len:135 (-) Transcript_22694:154-558(-)